MNGMMPRNVAGTMQVLKNFRSYFFKVATALWPAILTIGIAVQCYFFIQDKVSTHINHGAARCAVEAIAVCFVGVFSADVMGRAIRQYTPKNLMKVAMIRRICTYMNQATSFLPTRKEPDFQQGINV